MDSRSDAPAAAVLGRSPRGALALASLGIVYGDLGTSPLYTLQTIVQSMGGRFTPESALGVLSLIIWTLIITVSVKYCFLVMRADNHGEGGILALMALIGANNLKGKHALLTAMGLLGAALIYGDGVITPAISVLSALEGVNVVTDALKPWVMPIAVVILAALFAVQRFGTARIGEAFGPIMLIWFIVIALLGVSGIVQNPAVLGAINPVHAVTFLLDSQGTALLVLGGVFLCVTGGEALYADMGHFGRGPIRLSWFAIVLPALVINYAGQTALLLKGGPVAGNPFFLLAPAWSIYPLVMLATIATVIASQAIITGSFSMTRQAMQLNWLPAVNIRQTSDKIYGQIYVPAVNVLMMIATVSITIAFKTSDHLAGAYGTAVSTTMLVTTALLFTAMREIWRWPLAFAAAIAGVFVTADAVFFCANLIKIADGGWLPLTIGAAIFVLMTTWRSGIDAIREATQREDDLAEKLPQALAANQIPRVPGTAIFLSRNQQTIPPLLVKHVKQMGALHETVVALSVVFAECPRIVPQDRCNAERVFDNIWRVTLRYGYVEIPNLHEALEQISGPDPKIDLARAVYFGSRDLVVRKKSGSSLDGYRLGLFAFLYRNAVKTVDRFDLPAANVVEIAREIEL